MAGDITVKSTGISRHHQYADYNNLNVQRSSDFEDMEIEEVDSDEWDDNFENLISVNDCLFCGISNENVVQNLTHMSSEHSFFIPDVEYCIDIEGLLAHLGEKICQDFICIWCNFVGRTFYSLAAVRKHMKDKCHCRILYEGNSLAEFIDFYDYSSSYPDHSDEVDIDDELEISAAVEDIEEYHLILPSGVKIGHRSLMRYYKQRIDHSKPILKKSDRKMHRVLAEYK